MRVYELDISWATTAEERQHLRSQLLACDELRGVFLTTREDALAVLYNGDRRSFDSWAQTLEPDRTREAVAREALQRQATNSTADQRKTQMPTPPTSRPSLPQPLTQTSKEAT